MTLPIGNDNNILNRINLVKDIKNRPIEHLYPYGTDLNAWAIKSMETVNDAGKISLDEAISIHIITNALSTRLNILYEGDITGHGGKPDFIVRLGKNLLIMVSTTRSFHLSWSLSHGRLVDVFDYNEALRLMTKKIKGLSHCIEYSEAFANNLYTASKINKPKKYNIRPILHVLAPNYRNMRLVLRAYKTILANRQIRWLVNIRVIVSLVRDTIYQ
jgi:hypothetical protein